MRNGDSGFFVIQGSYVVSYPGDPGSAQGWPYYWYPIVDANVDGYQHFQGSNGSYSVGGRNRGRNRDAASFLGSAFQRFNGALRERFRR
jgi:hypothetical protein